jgi:hypothetical protein
MRASVGAGEQAPLGLKIECFCRGAAADHGAKRSRSIEDGSGPRVA